MYYLWAVFIATGLIVFAIFFALFIIGIVLRIMDKEIREQWEKDHDY